MSLSSVVSYNNLPFHRKLKTPRFQLVCRATTETSCEIAVKTLKDAAKNSSVPAKEVFASLRAVQKAKLNGDAWAPIIGCGKYWRLVYTAKKETVAKALKNPEDTNIAGSYVPFVATQRFTFQEGSKGSIQTGAYLPYIAAVEFDGEAESSGKKLSFDMKNVRVKLGPFVLGPISVPTQTKEGTGGPFFTYFYADEDIICAIGRSGGMAMWAKAEPTFMAQNGIEF